MGRGEEIHAAYNGRVDGARGDGRARLMQREAVYAFQYQGKRYDCGSKEGFLEATVELALQHPQVGASFREYLKGLSL
jgi:UTP--glucose-1-phosphate uridylyltransferase